MPKPFKLTTERKITREKRTWKRKSDSRIGYRGTLLKLLKGMDHDTVISVRYSVYTLYVIRKIINDAEINEEDYSIVEYEEENGKRIYIWKR